MNICVGHIARRQAVMDGFGPKASPPPPLAASKDEDDDNDDDATAFEDDDDGDASFSGTNEMST